MPQLTDRLNPTALKLLAILLSQRRGRSFRGLAKLLGVSIQAVQCHVKRLQRLGLITHEPWPNFATLRPTCRFIPEDELCGLRIKKVRS